MAFLRTVPPEDAEGELREVYQEDIDRIGYVPNYTQALSLRPEAIRAWQELIGVLRRKMRLRRYELVTVAAVTEKRCRY